MDILRRLSWAFVAGCIGAIALYVGVTLLLRSGFGNIPAQQAAYLGSKAFLYRSIVWGGIWGFAFVIPFLAGKWWARGLLVGLAATLVSFFVFRGGLPADVKEIIAAAVLNMVFWGLAAAFWHDKVMTRG
jgi:hypothetical protein